MNRHAATTPAVTALAATALVAASLVAAPVDADPRTTDKTPVSVGFGGAVSTVDPEASRIGLEVLRRGGNAVDAAVAAAAALGVTEPYSAGIGGGGYFVHYDAATGAVETLDGRETAPAAMPENAFIDPATDPPGQPYPFAELVTSGMGVGVPGTPATWQRALDRWGTWRLGTAIRPAARLANRGFVVDATFRQQTLDNRTRFAAFTSTSDLFLPGGDAPLVGTVFKNPDLAETYHLIADQGLDAFYGGPLAGEIVEAVQDPPTTPDTTLTVRPGFMETSDLAAYTTIDRAPTHVGYRGYDVYGMAPSSSGGSTVGEALNILEQFDLSAMSVVDVLHHYLEASALAFADRGKYLGDPAYVDVPLAALLDDTYAKERACKIRPATVMAKPTGPGNTAEYDGVCDETAAGERDTDTENLSTTNLTVADRWGNVVEYTLTIEQTGGSGIVVPGRGFLLNNELTDFSAVPSPTDPNRLEPGKRPRSSMSPTIVLRDGEPFLALGSPGGSMIITTVLQMLVNRLDLGMTIEEAIAAPRAAQRNTANVTAEPEFITAWGAALAPYGHTLVKSGDAFTSAAEIGAATAIEFGPGGLFTAVSEPRRRGGGSALVLVPAD
jgi:gamma-glutamyltranspeptidase/glutathione hydrolase